jgi:uncharacterized protein (DUF1697 family)
MPRYAAFLRGVSPMNAKMPELKRAFEAAGFTEVRTLLSSGNVSFETRAASASALERKCEDAMRKTLGKPFLTLVRPIDALRAMLESDPFSKFRLAPGAKRVVTFLRKAPTPLELPMVLGGARILRLEGNELFTAYVAGDKTPVFMTLIERAVGKEQTTRTWQTIEKVSR